MEKTSPQTVASAVALTTTLAGVGSALAVRGLDSALVQVKYAPGTGGTGAEYDFEISGAETEPALATDWWPAKALSDESATPASGVVVAPRSRVVHQLVTAEPRQSHWLDLDGVRWLRMRAKETTATSISAAGHITATAYGQRG